MGTSNWQQIPFCVEALMKIAPSRVLDVGVGFGRWGMITREFCDVWFGRIFRDKWQVRLEGIEAFPKSISDYHREFYDNIHLGDAADILPRLPGRWSVTIYGDVLEHFPREKAIELLSESLDRSDYVLVNIPIGEYPQGEAYGNAYERHLSTWTVADLFEWPVVRHTLLRDYIGRDYGSFVLSRNDPSGLKSPVFSQPDIAVADAATVPAGDDFDRILARVREQSFELAFVKRSASYRMAARFRAGALGKVALGLKFKGRNLLSVRPLPEPRTSRRPEVRVASIHAAEGEPGIPWEFVDRRGGFSEIRCEPAAYGRCLRGHEGEISVYTGPDPSICFMRGRSNARAEVKFNGRCEVIELSSDEPGTLVVRPGRSPMSERPPEAALEPRRTSAAGQNTTGAAVEEWSPEHGELSGAERAFLARAKRANARVVAMYCPRWLGVTSATKQMFEHCLPVPHDARIEPRELDEEELVRCARVLIASGVSHLVVSGGDAAHLRVAEIVQTMVPAVTIDLLWHGSYTQIQEGYTWDMMRRWIEAAKKGTIRSIMTVKAGMEEFFRANGVPSGLLLNRVDGETLTPPEIEGHETQVGLWISGDRPLKTPHAMLCALSMVGGVRLHGAGLNQRALELAEYLKIPTAQVAPSPLPQDQLPRAMRRTHVSMYVTFSECCPMLPLESLQQGVPCLIGPVSHLFEDNPFLFERLVVPSPDRADVIARYLKRAVLEREEIIAQWRRHASIYNMRARASVDRYLTEGPSLHREHPAPAASA